MLAWAFQKIHLERVLIFVLEEVSEMDPQEYVCLEVLWAEVLKRTLRSSLYFDTNRRAVGYKEFEVASGAREANFYRLAKQGTGMEKMESDRLAKCGRDFGVLYEGAKLGRFPDP